MKNRKDLLKEAGFLLVVSIFVLTAIVSVPTTIAQPQHDVGICDVLLPCHGCNHTYTIEVMVKNYEANSETTDVLFTIIREDGFPEYASLVEDVTVHVNQEKKVKFDNWTPTKGCINYTYTACTLLADDDSKNDCMRCKIFIGIVDIEITNIWDESISSNYPRFKVVKAEIKNN